MPVIRDIALSLKAREVLRREGFREYSKARPEINSILLELLASVKRAHLLEPIVVYEIYSATEISHNQISLEGNAVVPGSLLPFFLPEAKELAVVVGTIGPKLEKQVTDYSAQGEPLRSVLLDGIGSAAVDSLTQEVCKVIAGEASSHGYQASSPISPGMPELPITAQWQLFEMVSAWEIGVSLTSLGIMVPRKSASMVMGIGPEMKTWAPVEICARCHLRETCPYRIHSPMKKQGKITEVSE
jgi:hypothetical protein